MKEPRCLQNNKRRRCQTIYFLASLFFIPHFFAGCATSTALPATYFDQLIQKQNHDFYYSLERFTAAQDQLDLHNSRLDFPNSQQVTISLQENGASKKRGGSCLLNFTFSSPGNFSYQIPVSDSDLSQALALSLLIQSKQLPPDAFSVVLQDKQGREQAFTSPLVNKRVHGWKRLFFDLQNASKVDLNQLALVRLVIRVPEACSGQIGLDEIQLIGEQYFVQHSKEDTIPFFSKLPDAADVDPLLKMQDPELLLEIARATWTYLEATVDKNTGLPVDRVDLNGKNRVQNFTTPTNVGLYLASCLAAKELGFIDERVFKDKLDLILDSLEKLPKWKGFFYNFYDTSSLENRDAFISSIDNGWLAVCLTVLRQAREDSIKDRSSRLLNGMDFGIFLNEKNNHLNLGYDAKTETRSEYDYGLLCTEARATSYLAIGRGEIPSTHWFALHRAFPESWTWQNQIPKGRLKTIEGQNIFQGYYEYEGIQIVPSWGGSLFEFLMPTLFLNEKRYAPQGLGENDRRAVLAHIKWAKSQGYPIWGISPCAIPGNNTEKYGEFGVSAIGAKGYEDKAIITPHASFLALDFLPKESLENVRNTLRLFPEAYTTYGFMDSIDVKSHKIARSFLCLDQEMIFLSIFNNLNPNRLRILFHKSKEARTAIHILQSELFY